MPTKPEKDEFSGTDTTGHEWDGIKELDSPLPRWWLYIMFATILFALVYWVLYPAWPWINTYSRGLLGYNSRAQLAEEVEAARAQQAVFLDRMQAATVEEIAADRELFEFAMAGGRSAFAVNCSQCHSGQVQQHLYGTGAALAGAGVVSGHDMTPEAALTKLYCLLAAGLSPGDTRRRMAEDIAGEITLRPSRLTDGPS